MVSVTGCTLTWAPAGAGRRNTRRALTGDETSIPGSSALVFAGCWCIHYPSIKPCWVGSCALSSCLHSKAIRRSLEKCRELRRALGMHPSLLSPCSLCSGERSLYYSSTFCTFCTQMEQLNQYSTVTVLIVNEKHSLHLLHLFSYVVPKAQLLAHWCYIIIKRAKYWTIM